MPKWVYPLAFLFVLFLIYNDPTGAGDTAGNFAGFIVQLLSAVGEFLTGLFQGTSSATSTTGAPQPSGGTGTTATTIAQLADSFTHTHGDLGVHTHTSTGN